MSDTDNLFDEFASVSSKQWKQKIQVDLKGADYNKTLLSHTLEGITIKPFYHSDNFRKLDIHENNSEFQICQTIFIHDEKVANFLAKDALKRGANSIQFIANKPFELKTVLDGLNTTTLFFQFLFLDLDFILKLLKSKKKQIFFVNIDLIGNLIKTGNWFFNKKKDHEILRSILQKESDQICFLGVDAAQYQNAGANVVQQVAYALSHANEYLNFISEHKINSVKKINFSFGIGSNYFFEIGKLRAFRYLWNQLLKEYNLSIEINIFVQPTFRNKTLYDYNVNMLRTTSENMSGILGGADTISNISYDTLFHKKNEFGERIARNQLIILKEESNIKSESFTKGSYYIEDLTYEIAEKALQIFKDIEKNGGFVKQIFKGTIQRKINENAQKEQDMFDTGKLVLLGTNKYPNEKDKMNNDLEIYPFLKVKKKETEIQPIIAKRLSEKLEKERIEKE
jgi:methylmalonyl-CoA mutase